MPMKPQDDHHWLELAQTKRAQERRRKQLREDALRNEIAEEIDTAREELGMINWDSWAHAPEAVNMFGCRYIRADLAGCGLDILKD